VTPNLWTVVYISFLKVHYEVHSLSIDYTALNMAVARKPEQIASIRAPRCQRRRAARSEPAGGTLTSASTSSPSRWSLDAAGLKKAGRLSAAIQINIRARHDLSPCETSVCLCSLRSRRVQRSSAGHCCRCSASSHSCYNMSLLLTVALSSHRVGLGTLSSVYAVQEVGMGTVWPWCIGTVHSL